MSGSLQQILEDLKADRIDLDRALAALQALAHEPLGFATIDHDRLRRCGAAETILAHGKTPQQVVEIARKLVDRGGRALVTRLKPEHLDLVRANFPQVQAGRRGGTALIGEPPPLTGTPLPLVSAGTSDEPVLEEAEITCLSMGQPVHRVTDVGVAGLGRLIARVPELRRTGALVCFAGMEGALPSVLAGLVDVPVIAVPTSVGYGAAFGGATALLGMLTSCAAGVSVVNIDNGYGAAYTATLIQRQYDLAQKAGQA